MAEETKDPGVSEVIGEIEKNSRSKLIVSVREYRGFNFVDVREHFKMGGDKWTPTKKGITLNSKVIAEFLKMMEMAEYKLMKKETPDVKHEVEA